MLTLHVAPCLQAAFDLLYSFIRWLFPEVTNGFGNPSVFGYKS